MGMYSIRLNHMIPKKKPAPSLRQDKDDVPNKLEQDNSVNDASSRYEHVEADARDVMADASRHFYGQSEIHQDMDTLRIRV